MSAFILSIRYITSSVIIDSKWRYPQKESSCHYSPNTGTLVLPLEKSVLTKKEKQMSDITKTTRKKAKVVKWVYIMQAYSPTLILNNKTIKMQLMRSMLSD